MRQINWKACLTDAQFDGALQSWQQTAKYKDDLDAYVRVYMLKLTQREIEHI